MPTRGRRGTTRTLRWVPRPPSPALESLVALSRRPLAFRGNERRPAQQKRSRPPQKTPTARRCATVAWQLGWRPPVQDREPRPAFRRAKCGRRQCLVSAVSDLCASNVATAPELASASRREAVTNLARRGSPLRECPSPPRREKSAFLSAFRTARSQAPRCRHAGPRAWPWLVRETYMPRSRAELPASSPSG